MNTSTSQISTASVRRLHASLIQDRWSPLASYEQDEVSELHDGLAD